MINNLKELRIATRQAIKQTSEKELLTLGKFESILNFATKLRDDANERRSREEDEIHRKALEAAFDY